MDRVPAGRLAGERVVITGNDWTDREEAVEAALAALQASGDRQRVEALGRLATAVAHRVNNLVQVALGNLELEALQSQSPRLDAADAALRRVSEVTDQLRIRGVRGASDPGGESEEALDQLMEALGAAFEDRTEVPAASPDPGATHVLVVDDDAMVRRVVTLLLDRAGHHVQACASAEEALAAVAQRTPDVLLTDVRMPGLSGPELAQRLRVDHPDLPVVLMSGHTVLEPHEPPVDGALFLPKPFKRAALLEALAAVLTRP